MNTRRWERISGLLEQALDLDAAARRDLYAGACADDPTVGEEVERLVRADGGARGFLEVEHAPAPPPPTRALGDGSRIGGYTLVRRVAAGGMGVVFEARQERPNRRVALKLVQSLLVDESTLRRFRYEAEALGRLRHPGIAQVYEAGVDVDAQGGERPFLAMEFVDGARSVTGYAQERSLGYDAIARLFVDVCAAVQHGHDHGVLHRDLKASNVLVDASGAVKVIDFGIARVLGEQQTRATLAGELVGTLASMSPEQLDGDLELVDVRSDVYALGALLYEMLCGVPPIDLRGLSLTEALARARESTPANPTSVRADVPRELEWIVMRALEHDRERRYPSAADLARDLDRFLGDEPVLASPPSTVYRLRKFVRRNRIVVAATAAVAVALVAGTVVSLVQRRDAVLAKDRAETAESLAVERLQRLEVEARTNRELAEFQSGILRSPDPDIDGKDVRVVDVLARSSAEIERRADLEPKLGLALRRSIADAYVSLDMPREADAELQRMVPIWESEYPPTDPARLSLELARLSNDAYVASAADRESRARDGLARAQAVLGPDSPDTAVWGLGLAVALADLGRPQEGEALARKGLEVLRAKLGPTSKEALDGAIVVGRILNDSRRYAEAESFKRDAYEQCRAGLGEDRAETLRLKKQLAFAIGQNDRPEEAVAMLREVIEGHTRRTGPHSVGALTARADLAEFLRRSKRHAESLVEIDAALADGRAAYGERHAYVYRGMLRRSLALLGLGRSDEALADLRKTLETVTDDLGPDDSIRLELEAGLVAALFQTGRYDEALPYARDCYERTRRTIGERSALTAGRGNSYGALLTQTMHSKEAIPVFVSVLEAQDALLGPYHANSLTTLGNISTSLLGSGDAAGAECHAEQLLVRVLAKPDAAPDEIATAYWTLGRVRRELGDLPRASICFAFASAHWERARHPDSRLALLAMIDEAQALDSTDRKVAARALLERAAAAALAGASGASPEIIARALVTLARWSSDAGDVEGARGLVQIVLAAPGPIPAGLRKEAEQLADPR